MLSPSISSSSSFVFCCCCSSSSNIVVSANAATATNVAVLEAATAADDDGNGRAGAVFDAVVIVEGLVVRGGRTPGRGGSGLSCCGCCACCWAVTAATTQVLSRAVTKARFCSCSLLFVVVVALLELLSDFKYWCCSLLKYAGRWEDGRSSICWTCSRLFFGQFFFIAVFSAKSCIFARRKLHHTISREIIITTSTYNILACSSPYLRREQWL